MDETKLKFINRHDFIVISNKERQRIGKQYLSACPLNQRDFGKEVFFNTKYSIPGIARREESSQDRSLLPVGFVPCTKYCGQRLRIAAAVYMTEVEDVVCPEKILRMPFIPRNKCMSALADINAWAAAQSLSLGVLGSAGLEIFTGVPYTDKDSDLDLLMNACSFFHIKKIYDQLQAISRIYAVSLDLEISLPNGYGVKAAELFMETRTVLGKSLQDVVLLKREEILCLIN
jgi:phosphoribosyl-dephospho-CoA transferase